MNNTRRRIPPVREWLLLTRQCVLLMLGAKKDLAISLAFPVIAALITVWIAGEKMFVQYEGTKSACFVLVSAAIWGGLFNSIQTVVKERGNIRRDYMAGMRLRSYTASRAIVQFVLCAVQSAILSLALIGVSQHYGNDLPERGLLFDQPMIEYYISLLLLMYASDAMGLLFSCMVRKAETANVLAPYVLIVQLIFSGILFNMEGFAEKVSCAMLSHWGMEAMGSISDLNSLTLKVQELVPTAAHEAEGMFEYTPEHLEKVWLILAGFAVLFVVVGNLLLHRISRDSK